MANNAHTFGKLAKQRKADLEALAARDQRINALEAALKRALTDREAFVRQALETQKAQHAEDWRQSEQHHDSVKSTLKQALRDLDETKGRLLEQALRNLDETKGRLAQTTAVLEQTRALLAQSNQLVETERAGVATERARVAEMQPQLDLIAQQRADLERVLDSVRARMKRQDYENERAILNRQVIANARPALNRR